MKERNRGIWQVKRREDVTELRVRARIPVCRRTPGLVPACVHQLIHVCAGLPLLAILAGCGTTPEEDSTFTPTAPASPTTPAASSTPTTIPTPTPLLTPTPEVTHTPSPSGEQPLINPSRFNTVLGRPTDHSIAVSVLASAGAQAYVELSTSLNASRDALTGEVLTTTSVTSQSGEPIVVDVQNLLPNTRYYYRVLYAADAGRQTQAAFEADNLHTFMTQRSPGSTFSFGVQGDTHPERYNNKMFNAELMGLTMAQVRDRQPDFYVMLGDDFSIEKIVQDFEDANFGAGYEFHKAVEGSMPYDEYLSTIETPLDEAMIVEGEGAPTGNGAYRELREQYLGVMANASALFLVNGNHEQAHAANLGGLFNNAAIWAGDARLKYYPLPAPDGFYSGDQTPLTSRNGYPTLKAADGLRRDYYAFTWGDALFVTIDPYWQSEAVSPDSSLYNGDPVEKWAPTMGDEQYQWLKKTLEGSNARWKFVFAHHINGDGRGGAACVGVQEWGGKVSDFQANRPTWAKPIHRLLVDTGVTVFFQGHDHTFAREVVDGVVYQEVPNPADNSYFAYNCTAYAPAFISWQGGEGYGVYDPDYSVVMPDTGFLNVTVTPDHVNLQYIRTYRPEDLEQDPNAIFTGTEQNGEVAFSYSLPPQPGDDDAADFRYTCLGDAPPTGWVYLP